MTNPAQVFGNPRPSGRVLRKGDIINMELAAGYRGYTAQIGSPICIGPPTDMVKRFWDEIALPGFEKMAASIKPGMVFMAEPNPITADGNFGIFLGHTFIVSPAGHEIVDNWPLELVVV